MPQVFVSDDFEPPGLQLLEEAGLDVDYRPGLKGAELAAAVHSAEGVIVRSATRITAELLAQSGSLRAIVRAGVGVDNIDVATATAKGIVVMNTPAGNTVSTAEHALALLFALMRQVPFADQSVKQGRWERGRFIGVQLSGKTLGILGLGRIGREVARRALAMDMRVIGFDPLLTRERAAELGIEAQPDRDAVLSQCDILTLHAPLTADTRDLIGARELALMKRGARLINCARGGLVNEEALAEALRTGRLAGAAVDVFAVEPPPPDHPLLQLPNLVATPHLGASTVEAQASVAREAAQLMIDYLMSGVVQHAVNFAGAGRAELNELRPLLDLARRLGLFLSQMSAGAIRWAKVEYRGDATAANTQLLTASFAAGLLERRLDQPVNLVNAQWLARERGIELVELKSTAKGDFASLIRVTAGGEAAACTAAGTLFGRQYLRLVQLGPFHLDAYLDGVLLVIRHRDLPGLIGFIGSILGDHGINIAQMNVGRQAPGGDAIAILNLDAEPSDEVLRQVASDPRIAELRLVELPPPGQAF